MHHTLLTYLRSLLLTCLLLPTLGHTAQLDIPGPTGSGLFGSTVTVLPNGNFVVTDPGFDLPGPISDVGAVYLYSASGSLISTLTGSTASDAVGTTVTVLANGNFVVRSASWNGSRAAVTWGSASSGVAGVVSAVNSLVGGTVGDIVGSISVTALSNGNYVVASPSWDNPVGSVVNAGAVTWGNGSTGTIGLVSASNSLVGGTATDNVGNGGVAALSNGNYVVRSSNWDNPTGPIADVGAVTWGNGSVGTAGLVTSVNSLVGGTAFDMVGNTSVTALSNGNYVVASQNWDNPVGPATNAGAVTWGNGSVGTAGLVTSVNSLVGGTMTDQVGSPGITALSNGNYVVRSTNWDNPVGPASDAGAVTWGNGSVGTAGLVTSGNSLVGGTTNDAVGNTSVTALSNGNYVVASQSWGNPVGPAPTAGAVTWGNGSVGTAGLVTSVNSLVGGTTDRVGNNGVTALSNGNYVVGSSGWDNPVGLIANVGAVTWGNGSTGTAGLVTSGNSLVGGTAFDAVGSVTALSNGNYVVASQNWDNPVGPVPDVGAVTWGNGSVGTAGLVTSVNSLVGGTMTDRVGNPSVTALSNGNYVVRSSGWDNPVGSIANAGAVTWGNGSVGTAGLVTSGNSLVGGTTNDTVGNSAVVALSNGNYVARNTNWDNPVGPVPDVGAVTWGNGSVGTSGLVSSSNSLVGGTMTDQVGNNGVTALSNGNYVVHSRNWDATAPATVDSGAITRGIGTGGTTGLIDTSNSVLGTAASGGTNLVFSYDLTREHLIVGRRSDNIVTIFSDQAAPSASTLPASSVSTTAATLNASVDPNDQSTTVEFEYGLTMAYGSTISATPSPLTGAGAQTVSAALTGLTANATYHFRIRATNVGGLTLGLDQSFVARNAGLQVGSVTLPATVDSVFFPNVGPRSNAATRVNFAQAFGSTPVVIVQPSDENPDPQSLRVTNISSSGFDVLQVEPPGGTCNSCDARGPAMTVHWLAALPGSYRLSNDVLSNPALAPSFVKALLDKGTGTGVLLKVGSVSTTAHQRRTDTGFTGWPGVAVESVLFSTAFPAGEVFGAPPVVLSTVQSWNISNEGFNLNLFGAAPALRGPSAPWATTVASNVLFSGFDIALEASEVDDDDQDGTGFGAVETLGYVAIESGVSVNLTQLGGGAGIGLATGTLSTVTDACTISNLSFPSSAPIVAANLRGFAGKQTRTEADGGWLRRCALATSGDPNVSMSVRIDEDADLDAERTHVSETIGTAIFGGDFSTTPVTLAQAQVQRQGDSLALSFASATEIGHLGYRIWGRSNKANDWQLLSSALIISSSGDGFTGKQYSQTLPAQLDAVAISEVRIEDVDILGHSRFHPALAVGANVVTSVGAPPVDAPLDWDAIRSANAATPQRSVRSSAVQALLDVSEAGIYRVRFEALAAFGFAAGTPASQIALLDAGQPVLRHVSCSTLAAGCFVEFVGRKRESLYGSNNVYTLVLDAKSARPVASGGIVGNVNAPRSLPAELSLAPNRGYSFSAPGSDPWFDQRLVASNTPAELTRSFSLPGRVAGAVNLRVMLWGGTDFAGNSPDHSVELLLNGQALSTRRFDGLVAEQIDITLPENLLQATNTWTLRVPNDTGYSADVILLDGYRVSYPRRSEAQQGSLSFGEVNPTPTVSETIFASRFEDNTRDGFLIEGVQANSVLWTQVEGHIYRDALSTNASVDSAASGLMLQPSSAVQELNPRAGIEAATNVSLVDYLIVTHPLFEAELGSLIALQQSRGYSVRVLRTDAIYAERSDSAPDPQAIRSAIAAINPRFVLLVGGDSYDYHDYLGIGSQSYLPTFYRVANQFVRFAASDHLFVDANSDGLPERALGRIPARTVAELRLALDSILARGNVAARRYFATAGSSAAHEQFATHSHALLSYLRQGQPTEFALADEIGSAVTKDKARAALAGSADWINYLGHSSPNRWAFDNLLDTSQLASISRSGLPAVVSQWGCWNNYFVLPNQDTMAHALMLRSNRLASAVIGSSSLAEDASHLALGTRFFDVVEDGRIGDISPLTINTLGEALLTAKKDLVTRSPEFIESVYSIMLFGDPAAPIR